MDLNSKLEEALGERKKLEQRLNNEEHQLMKLDAYKRTFVKCMCHGEISSLPPTDFQFNPKPVPFEVEDEYPLIVLNVGKFFGYYQDNISYIPVNFKCLRKFKKIDNNEDFTWYTTTVLKKNDSYYFVIKDDENNCWSGVDAFFEFSKRFDFQFPFKSIIEWLGLHNQKVRDAFLEQRTMCKL
jgi:hypothetical protein